MLLINKIVVVVLVLLTIASLLSLSEEDEHTKVIDYTDGFVFNGFGDAASNLTFGDSVANISIGRLRLTNIFDGSYQIGQAFYSRPFRFKNVKQNSSSATESSSKGNNTNSTYESVFSFSTSFVFSILPDYPLNSSGHGLCFVIAPQKELPGAKASIFLGLFNSLNVGESSNHILAVELDTVYNEDVDTVKGEHVGIDINGLTSVMSKPSMYYRNNNSGNRSLSLMDQSIRVWIEYDGVRKKLSVTIAPSLMHKPNTPLLSYDRDLSDVILDWMYVGFTSSTGFAKTTHYIWGWNFKINGTIFSPVYNSSIPELPRRETNDRKAKILGVQLPIIIPVLFLVFIIGILFVVKIIWNRLLFKTIRNDDTSSTDGETDLEQIYGRLKFSYEDLNIPTKGFDDKELLGVGGFGRVYRGVLPISEKNIAVKKISRDSKQGIKEFISEIISMGHLRHRNLAHLLGYCRRNKELLLVYDYMPNGSLDKLIFRKSNSTSSTPILDWNQRFQIIKGVACGLIYLHEECEQVVIHRDIKASNVLLDGEMNARLGDFGLARLHERGAVPKTTKVVGTWGYIAPEMAKSGKETTWSDVYAFGALLLEVACGRRPTELHKSGSEDDEEGDILVYWVLNCWRSGAILQTSDPNLEKEYIKEEMELVLKLGLLCSHRDPKARPSMKQVMQYLEGELPLPDMELWELDQDDSPLIRSSSGER